MSTPEEWITGAEAARRFRVARSTFNGWVHKGLIQSHPGPTSRRYYDGDFINKAAQAYLAVTTSTQRYDVPDNIPKHRRLAWVNMELRRRQEEAIASVRDSHATNHGRPSELPHDD